MLYHLSLLLSTIVSKPIVRKPIFAGKKTHSVRIIVQTNPWGMGARPWFHRASYIVDFRVYIVAQEITALFVERTDVSQISRSSSVPICRVRVSENLEGTLDGVPAAFRLAVTYVLSALVRVSH